MELHSASGRWSLGMGLAVFTALQWGSLPILLKGLVGSLDAYTITWYRFFTTFGFLLVIFLVRRKAIEPLFALRGGHLVLLAVAVGGLCANHILYLIALVHLSPSTAQVLIQLSSMFLLLGSLTIFKESFSSNQWLGLAFLLVGLVLFFNQSYDEISSGRGSLLKGGLIMTVAALLWAVYALAQKQLLRHLSPEAIIFAIYLGGTLLFLPTSDPGAALELERAHIALLAICSLVGLASYLSFARALEHMEASRFSVVHAATPLITAGGMATWARLFPGLFPEEHLNALSLFGACLVVVGSALGSWRKASQS